VGKTQYETVVDGRIIENRSKSIYMGVIGWIHGTADIPVVDKSSMPSCKVCNASEKSRMRKS
jgi:hypothetical protein